MRNVEATDSTIAEEFSCAEFGDVRLTRRLATMAKALEPNPSISFPKAAGTEAALEATYRFLRNEAVTPEAILAPHQEATAERVAEAGLVLVLHDTTTFSFGGELPRRGLGRLHLKSQGFLGHFALAVTADGTRWPLGVLAMQTLFRTEPPRGKRSHRDRQSDPNNESRRWLSSVEVVEQHTDRGCVVHVMDREADAYDLLASMVDGSRRFVIRAAHDRLLAEKGGKRRVADAVSSAEAIAEREVPLSNRAAQQIPRRRTQHPPRQYRMAHLAFSATSVTLARPSPSHPGCPRSIALNVIHVREIDAPGDQQPVSWTLFTTESIETAGDVLQVVDWYRARWTIEEYFRALKQGCSYEDRQLETRETLLNALAIFVPIAWRLLLLRSLARTHPEAPATAFFTETQIEILAAITRDLSPTPTLQEAMQALAKRGGHLRANGPPGWLVLGRGYHDLLLIEIGWNARGKTRKDQS